MRKLLKEMITTNIGSISSKIVIGALTYVLLCLALVILMFVNPLFPGLADLITIFIITSGSLLGLTTIENIKQIPGKGGKSKERTSDGVQNKEA